MLHTRDDKASVDDAGTHIVVFVVAEATWPDADDDECERLGGDTFPAIDDEATTEGEKRERGKNSFFLDLWLFSCENSKGFLFCCFVFV